MENITVFRIDDRLIHGQIVTAWAAYADAKQIVVADDMAAGDSLQQSLLKMATPKAINLKIMTLDDAKEYLYKEDDPLKTLFLVRGPVQAKKLLDDNKIISTINVGNLNMKKGKTKILDNLWVFEEDVQAFKELFDLGIDVEFRTVPNDSKQSVKNLIDKL